MKTTVDQSLLTIAQGEARYYKELMEWYRDRYFESIGVVE